VLSPSYFKSKWCAEEWKLVSDIERKLRTQGRLPDHYGLIVPILLYPLNRGIFSNPENRLIADAKQRQWHDFSSATTGTPMRPTQVRTLVESIIDIISELDSAAASTDVLSTGTLIIDTKTNLMWSGVLRAASRLLNIGIQMPAMKPRLLRIMLSTAYQTGRGW